MGFTRKEREELKQKGLCTRCGVRPRLDGFLSCFTCLQKRRRVRIKADSTPLDQTLCCYCDQEDCEYRLAFEPVEGWDADSLGVQSILICGRKSKQDIMTYSVNRCPKFQRGHYSNDKEFFRTLEDAFWSVEEGMKWLRGGR